MDELGFSSSTELLLPDSVKGLKTLLSVATHKKLWFPDRLHKDYLELMDELGFSSSTELLLPDSVKGLKTLLSVATHKKLWFPDCLHRDYLEVVKFRYLDDRRAELLEGLIVRNKDLTIPNYPQRIHLLWGENDRMFKMELAQKMKWQLGDNTTVEGPTKSPGKVAWERIPDELSPSTYPGRHVARDWFP
nr:epoxide hydrolase 4-like [Tanacetum cinerariifolium]